MYIDSHAHLDAEEFSSDLDEVVERARAAGVRLIITIGSTLEASTRGLEIAARHDGVFAAVGIHPHDVAGVDDTTYDALRTLLQSEKVVALGEVGLDYYRDYAPRDLQQRRFREQVRIARRAALPIIVHTREAHADTLRILEEEGAQEVGGVFHCFSGSAEVMKRCVQLGFYISLAGPVTYPKADKLRLIAQAVPVERLLIETDCPFLAPQAHRGRRNEPAYVTLVAEKIAELRGLWPSDVGRIALANARELFGIGPRVETGKVVYRICDSLYVNLTNRCTNNCVFCRRSTRPVVYGHDLLLSREPATEEVWQALAREPEAAEVVFCGYGEPLLRLDVVLATAERIRRERGHAPPIRINTNGQADLVYERSVLPELQGLIDAICVSLNAQDGETYGRLCRPRFGART